jgi:coenzyme F420-0:L-glutamate ligase/coenzyme F420-1:gamma-L-glutamate ligase
VLVVAHKVVSKAEGRLRRLADVEPDERARELAVEHGKDPRAVQVVLDEAAALLRAERGVFICETRQGFVCANAGVDASNAAEPDELVLLPVDPDGSARALRARIAELRGVRPAVIVSDSFGRAWRLGQTDVALGCAGIAPLRDHRGDTDPYGNELHITQMAIVDELSAAAELVKGKCDQVPVAVIRGLITSTADDGPGVVPTLVRDAANDMFSLGTAEAIELGRSSAAR